MHRLLAFAILALLVPQQPAAPALDAVLGKAGQFVIDASQVEVLAADEDYVQVYRVSGDADHAVTTGSAPPLGVWSGHTQRRIRSQYILLSDGDDGAWLAFRDAYEVDGKKLRDDRGRLEPMFAQSIDNAVPAAQKMSEAAIKYNKGALARAVHPTLFALTVFHPAHQASFAFEKKGEKKVGGVTVWVIAYRETAGGKFARTGLGAPTGGGRFIRTVEGIPQPIRGEAWIDPATGRVFKTTVVMDSLDAYPDMKARPERYENFPRMMFEVTYELDQKLNMWLPRELKENYDRQVELVTTTATYTNYRKVETK